MRAFWASPNRPPAHTDNRRKPGLPGLPHSDRALGPRQLPYHRPTGDGGGLSLGSWSPAYRTRSAAAIHHWSQLVRRNQPGAARRRAAGGRMWLTTRRGFIPGTFNAWRICVGLRVIPVKASILAVGSARVVGGCRRKSVSIVTQWGWKVLCDRHGSRCSSCSIPQVT
jgi:hypothetical protein